MDAMKVSYLVMMLIVCVVALGWTGADASTGASEELKGARVIAHRGFWQAEGSAQNSRMSLRKSIENGFYGSEIDVWLTADDRLVVNHDEQYNGVVIETATLEQCRRQILANGESMPTLEELLDMIRPAEVQTKLIIEIKTHADSLRGRRAARMAVDAVRKAGVEKKVEYIAFSLDICREVVRSDSTALVAYLNGDIVPDTLWSYGITGIDYYAPVYDQHPEYIRQCKKLGMTTNVWTLAGREEIEKYTLMGLDFVTTDTPLEAKAVYEEHRE